MEKDRRNQETCQGYYLSTPEKSRNTPIKNGETKIEGRRGANQIGPKQSSQGTTQAKYPHVKGRIWRESKESCWECEARKERSKGLYAYLKIRGISQK